MPEELLYIKDLRKDGKLVDNIKNFGRTLRAAGIPIGPDRIIDAITALQTVGITDREVFYWALHAVFVNRREQREIFDQAFHIFWRNPRLLERMLKMVLPSLKTASYQKNELDISQRVRDAFSGKDKMRNKDHDNVKEQEIQYDAVMSYSDAAILQKMDFEKMNNDEIQEAKRVLRRLRISIKPAPTRRFVAHPKGNLVDLRSTLQKSLRSGSDVISLKMKKVKYRLPPLVVLCDISGSMGRYSRMLLHFMHSVANDRSRVFTFLFGTKLTNVTRHLRNRDVDEALKSVGQAADDWSGGTRIGRCIYDFNKNWSRRVLGQGAIILLISDGLDRDSGRGLTNEIDRLQKSCKKLVWLNPLLRFDGFAPKSRGIKAIMPHVDEFRPIHSLENFYQLAEALEGNGISNIEGVSYWKRKAREFQINTDQI